jgi:branched-subunit amino acid transport protein
MTLPQKIMLPFIAILINAVIIFAAFKLFPDFGDNKEMGMVFLGAIPFVLLSVFTALVVALWLPKWFYVTAVVLCGVLWFNSEGAVDNRFTWFLTNVVSIAIAYNILKYMQVKKGRL